jgi:hypothetical protein
MLRERDMEGVGIRYGRGLILPSDTCTGYYIYA